MVVEFISKLGYMRGVSCIPCDKYFLKVLMEHWLDDNNKFHLSTGEIIITLFDIHHILQVLMKGTLMQRVTLSVEEMEEHYHWLTSIQDYQ